MRRMLPALGLLAVWPALALAQEPKLVNCRTLEAAGNFVGPDEVIVNDMVCQKAKLGAPSTASDAKASTEPPKPLLGTVVSDAPADSVVEAAKAAEKRIAERKEKEAQATAEQNAAGTSTPADSTTVASPASEAASAPPPSAKPASAAIPSSSSAGATSSPAPSTPPASTEAVAKPQPAPQPAPPVPASASSSTGAAAPSNAAPSPAPTAQPAASDPAPAEIVLSSAPATASAASPPVAEPKAGAPPASIPAASRAVDPVPTTPADAAAPPPRPAEALPPADPSRPATSSGFYDANAPKAGVNGSPTTNTGFASAEQVNAGLVPGATSIPPASQPATADSPAAGAPAAEPESHNTIAAARTSFDDPERDRSVKLGDFAQPREVSPDLNAEHRSSVDPSDADGFQDRQRPECTKNISLGGLKGEKLVLGVPAWAAKWIEKNEKNMPTVCFSETPMKAARNYLIVFYTPGGGANSKDIADLAANPTKPGSAAGVGTFSTNYGSTWHYSVDRNVGTTILTQDDADEPHAAPGQVLYATAYTEEGVPVSQRWPGPSKKEMNKAEKNPKKIKAETEALERVSSDLLGQLVEDIQKF